MIKYLAQENEIQKIYNDLGLIVPVGDLSTTKAPAIQPLPTSSTQTTVTAQFNVMSGGDITALSYKVNDGEAVSLTPAKGVVTITLEDLEYNSGPYEIELTATNATGSTVTSSTIDLQHYTNWATADEVLDGNKFIGEDGQEAVGTYVPEEPATGSLIVTANGEYTTEGTEWVGFDDVFVDVPTGPTDGGAVATGKQYSRMDPGMGTEIPVLDIVFSTLPTGFDTANHTYYMYIAAPYFAEGEDPENQSLMTPLMDGNDRYYSTQTDYDSTTQTYTIELYDLDFTHYGPSIATIVYIFEDDLLHLKWIVPCTFVDQTVNP